MRICDHFDKAASQHPDRPCVISDEKTVSYAEASDHSWLLGAALHARGFEVGDPVGILAPNVADAFLAMLGVWRAGGAWVPLNPLNSIEASIDFMNNVSCRWLLLHSKFSDHLEEIRRRVPSLRLIVWLDGPGPSSGGLSMAEFLATGAPEIPDWADPYGSPALTCALWPTGGTTGRSKAVVWTNQVWASLFETAVRYWPDHEHAVNLMVAPITHAAGVMAAIFAGLGGTIVIRGRFDAGDALDHIERHVVTHLFLPPTAYYDLLAEQQRRPRGCDSLLMILIAASPVSPDRLAEGVGVFGPCLSQSWGQAEAPFLLTYLGAQELAEAASGKNPSRLASCGRATLSSQVEIMSADGRILPPGERGELVARGRLVTPGYHRRDAENAEMRQHGWHHTGDIGYKDESGYVYIVDRLKEMIISGGFNVYPAEVETALLKLPEIRDCAVIGIPDERWGESVCAVVVPTQNGWADADLVMARAKEALGAVKSPKRVEFREELPKTAVGKIDKNALRKGFWKGMSRAVN